MIYRGEAQQVERFCAIARKVVGSNPAPTTTPTQCWGHLTRFKSQILKIENFVLVL